MSTSARVAAFVQDTVGAADVCLHRSECPHLEVSIGGTGHTVIIRYLAAPGHEAPFMPGSKLSG